MDKASIQKEIDRLENLMASIVLTKKTDFVQRNKSKLHKLRKLIRESK